MILALSALRYQSFYFILVVFVHIDTIVACSGVIILVRVQGGSAQEGGQLGKRQTAINLYESLCKSHKTKSAELQLVTLAVHINSVLCKGLCEFGIYRAVDAV